MYCAVISGTEIDVPAMRRAGNLHRSDLTVQETAQPIGEWVRLTSEKLAEAEPVSNARGRGKESGINAAVREPGADLADA